MFYSHTLLARKGPLGTVWIAAHLQHKLRKSQIAITDISTSVDYIMFPEVPIALRLSGFLLLGVVRIYSKKVDYLYHDCNEVLTRIRTAFASIQVNFPEDANQAPFHSITLPDRFELDALDIDDIKYYAEAPDNHLKTHEEITITEQIQGEGNPYVTFFVDEMDTSQRETPKLHTEPVEEDFLHLFSGNKDVDITDPGPSNQEERSHRLYEDSLPQDLPEIEILRDCVRPQPCGSDNLPVSSDLDYDIVEHLEPSIPIMNQKENCSPIAELFSVSGSEPLPYQLHPVPATASARSVEQHGTSDLRVSLGPVYSDIAIQQTSLNKKQKAKSRKRKQFFDESLVLTNELIKKQLQDTSKLLRKRKNLPLTTLDVWKSYKRLRKELIFFEPTIIGMCDDLHEVLKKGFCRVNPIRTEVLLEPSDAQSPSGTPAFEMEIEQPRFEEEHVDDALPEIMPSPSENEEFTPLLAGNLGSVLQTGKSLETEVLITPELTSSQLGGPESETPIHLFDEKLPVVDHNLPEFPDLLNSAEAEVLKFLESDNTKAGDEDEVSTFSVRTRAVAQYLRMQSPATHVSVDQSGDSLRLSLNRILEGKTKKQCARMLFETLVLLTCGFINVQQEEAYGDIFLSLTPALSKAKF